jgi:hypothetical protein
MTKLKTLLALTVAIAVAALVAPPILHRSADAQPVPSVVGPYNVDLGTMITNTAQIGGAAGDGLFSANQANFDQNGVMCVLNATVNSGSPSTTFSIQGFDAATATWHTLVTSGAVTATATPTTIVSYPGAVATSVPTATTIAGLPVPRVWRVSETVGASSSAGVTAKIGCNIIK